MEFNTICRGLESYYFRCECKSTYVHTCTYQYILVHVICVIAYVYGYVQTCIMHTYVYISTSNSMFTYSHTNTKYKCAGKPV
jgi:hypothetical protein